MNVRASGVLITGASGTLGRELLKALHFERAPWVFVLMRSKDGKSSRERFDQLLAAQQVRSSSECRVTLIEGDVTEACCGIQPPDMALLRDNVDTIFHVAAATHLNDSQDRCERVNLEGTIEAIHLARLLQRNGHLTRFVHFSTAFAPGSRQDYHSLEDMLPDNPCHANFYESSKYRAERRVREEMADGLPAIILRPSIVAGDSHTGAIGEFRVLYPIVKMFTLGLARVLPVSIGGVLHVVPPRLRRECRAGDRAARRRNRQDVPPRQQGSANGGNAHRRRGHAPSTLE